MIVVAVAVYQTYVADRAPAGDTSADTPGKNSSPIPSTGIVGRLPVLPPAPGRLDVYFLDVTLGDAIYIRTPTGEDVVIDGGDSPTELSSYLDMLGEKSIDVVVASHPHEDHVAGLPKVIEERHPKDVLDERPALHDPAL